MADKTYRLVTRSDFDGLVCAILLKQLGMVDENGDKQLVAGTHVVEVTNGAGNLQSFEVDVASAKVLDVVPRF